MTHQHGDILLVETPEGAENFRVFEILKVLTYQYGKAKITHEDDLPSGNYTILGLAKDLKSDDWINIVDKYHNGAYRDYELNKHFDPCNEAQPFCLTATESGLSLVAKYGMKPGNCLILKKK